MIDFTEAQLADLTQLQNICDELKTQLVVIGAMAYKFHSPDIERYTADIDLTVALDLEDFAELGTRLTDLGWEREKKIEHRWRSPRGTLIDLLPAGTKLREAKKLTWPESQFSMSLVGFDHVFAEAEAIKINDSLTIHVAPAAVLALLKIVAFLDRPHERQRDLEDLRGILTQYEEGSDRLFLDEVQAANLPDFGLTNAFLLGVDLHALFSAKEAAVVETFGARVSNEAEALWIPFAQGVKWVIASKMRRVCNSAHLREDSSVFQL
jgi:predicted nucleotidyltransferase